MSTDYDVIVLGAGMVGLSACAVAKLNCSVIDRRPVLTGEVALSHDARVCAINPASKCFLKSLSVMTSCPKWLKLLLNPCMFGMDRVVRRYHLMHPR